MKHFEKVQNRQHVHKISVSAKNNLFLYLFYSSNKNILQIIVLLIFFTCSKKSYHLQFCIFCQVTKDSNHFAEF